MLRKHHSFSKMCKTYNVKLASQISSKQVDGRFKGFKSIDKFSRVWVCVVSFSLLVSRVFFGNIENLFRFRV